MSEGAQRRRAVALNNRDAYAYSVLGAADLYSGRHSEALAQFEQAISLNRNDPHAHALVGRTLAYLGKGEEGLENVERAIRLSPRDPMIALWHSIRALCAFAEGRHEGAVEWARASIRAQPNRSTPYLDLAANSALCGQTDEARQAVAGLIALFP